MFEELRKRIKNGYFSFLAKRYIRNLSKKDSSKELSLDVVPEEVKYKVLEEGLTEEINITRARVDKPIKVCYDK